MINEYKKRYESFSAAEFYASADSEHQLKWYIGLDSEGNKALKLRGEFQPQKVEGTKFVQVRQFAKDETKTIVFSLIEDLYSSQFYAFVDDMVEMTKNSVTDQIGYEKAVRNFYRWKDMFQNCTKDYLSNEQIMGLIAELSFLKSELIPHYGEEPATMSWTGQELTHKDFYLGNKWYEIKAISVGKPSVKISSLEQLDSEDIGFLIVYQLEKVSSESRGISLNELIKNIYERMSSEVARQYFLNEVSKQGFAFHEHYDSIRYQIVDVERYRVDGEFPKLTRQMIGPQIIKAEYHLNIGLLSEFVVEDIYEN